MRSFIGLDLAARDKLAIDHWRQQALPPMAKAVPVANFHITLTFLGSINLKQQEILIAQLDEISSRPITLKLDMPGWFKKAQVLWLGCHEIPENLLDLAKATASAANASGIRVEKRAYVPHVTMARKTVDAPAALFTPEITCSFSHFHLFESVSGAKGVRYPIRHSWLLGKS